MLVQVLLLALFVSLDASTLSCSARQNLLRIAPDEYFSLENNSLLNTVKDSRTVLYENVTSFAFYPPKGRIFFTNGSGLHSFNNTILHGTDIRILGITNGELIFLRGNHICVKHVEDRFNCLPNVIFGIFVSSFFTFLTTISVSLLLSKQKRESRPSKKNCRLLAEREMGRTKLHGTCDG